MGRWTPLILMAGGLAILLGTLLGINVPMGGQQTAKTPPVRRAEGVLPANINVNSTATRNDPATSESRSSAANRNDDSATESRSSAANRNDDSATESRSNVAQNNTSTENTPDTTPDNSATETQSTETESTSTSSSNSTQDKEPIRALW
ncbi:hypothetical protein NIES4074_02040 [Cylindrospermum sp. NIES-4074]|nr:hypothetical protein NIES4074_02040 [Cylindrospermum sp. NIES-4074]